MTLIMIRLHPCSLRLMSDTSADDRIAFVHSELERLASEVRSGGVSLADLAITKQLTKNPADYADKKALPHVQVGNLLVSSVKIFRIQ